MTPPIQFNPMVRSAIYMQEHDLVNRGILDTLGAAAPYIGLARTPQERREKILDRIIVIGSAFVLAPLHAWVFMKLLARTHKLPTELMRLSYQDLLTPKTLQKGLEKIQQELPKLRAKPILTKTRSLETLRTQLIKAKTEMFIPDLTVECLIFGGVAWITNLFSRWYTGKNRFSGELKSTSEKNLEKLYEKEKGYQKSSNTRLIATLITSFGVPLLIGLLVRKAMLLKSVKPGAMNWIRSKAKWFDYQDGYWMSLPTLGIVIAMQFMGHLFAARNKRELRENFLRETALNVVFFWGTTAWMGLLTHMLYKPLKVPLAQSVRKVIELAPKGLQRRAANIASGSYWGSFALNCLSGCAVIVANNILTTHKVQSDVKKYGLSRPRNVLQSARPKSLQRAN